MPQEIERKFLVHGTGYRQKADKSLIRQGFLSTDKEHVVRIRITGHKAFLTVKGLATGASRPEFEYEIPLGDANYLLEYLCEKPIIEKNRFKAEYGGFTWEVDEFLGENEGLVIAEIELEYEKQPFPLPEWIGREVTGDPRYYNSSLVKHPYREWKMEK